MSERESRGSPQKDLANGGSARVSPPEGSCPGNRGYWVESLASVDPTEAPYGLAPADRPPDSRLPAPGGITAPTDLALLGARPAASDPRSVLGAAGAEGQTGPVGRSYPAESEGGSRPAVAAPGRRRTSRRRRLLRLVALLIVLAGIVTAITLIVTGRTVVPVVSEQVFPIHYVADIERVAERYDLDPYLVAAVAKAESSFSPAAVSPVGAVGIMQLMPATAEWITTLALWKGEGDPVLTDPADNLELGACYLAYLSDKFQGQTRAVLAAYNAGPGNVGGWVETAGGLAEFGLTDIPFEETRDFVQRVERFWILYARVHPDVFTAGGDAGAGGTT